MPYHPITIRGSTLVAGQLIGLAGATGSDRRRQRMRKSVVFIVAAAVLGWAVAQAGQELVGTWIANAAGQQYTLVLSADGTGNADG